MKKLALYLIFAIFLLGIMPGQSMAATIDVLVVYTPEALTHADAYDIWRGGVEAINAKIEFMISEANQIFLNSGINDHRLRLVGRHMVDHDETNDLQAELLGLALWDGNMDSVHTWRNEVGADIVCLIIATNVESTSGKSIGIDYASGFSGDRGFFVINQNALIVLLFPDRIGMLFTHELGHVLGCNHYIDDQGLSKPKSPDVAWRDEFDAISHAYAQKFWYGGVLYGTVMAVPNPSSFSYPIPYFSNHTVYYPPGWPAPQPTGTTTANNAGVIMQTANYVAGYRETTIPHGSIWVDTAWDGYQNGSVSYPYNSVQQGIDYVDFGGTIVFEHGSDPWTGTISKPMTLTAGIGEMVIGQ